MKEFGTPDMYFTTVKIYEDSLAEALTLAKQFIQEHEDTEADTSYGMTFTIALDKFIYKN